MSHAWRIRSDAYKATERAQGGTIWPHKLRVLILDAACQYGNYELAEAEDRDDDRYERPHPTQPWVISSNPYMPGGRAW